MLNRDSRAWRLGEKVTNYQDKDEVLTQLRETVDPLFCIGLEDFCICTDCYRKRHFSITTMNGNKPASTRSRSTECEGCEKVPDDFLEKRHSEDVDPLNHWVSRFVVELRNRDGKPYTPTSIHSLLAALLRYMRDICSSHSYNPNSTSGPSGPR